MAGGRGRPDPGSLASAHQAGTWQAVAGGRTLPLRPLLPLTRGCWTKDNQAGIDLVGADRDEPGDKLRPAFIGTIKAVQEAARWIRHGGAREGDLANDRAGGSLPSTSSRRTLICTSPRPRSRV